MSLHVTSETPWYGFLVTWPTFENSKTSSALELLTVKHVHIICYMLSFPSTFIRWWCCTCEELESIKKAKKKKKKKKKKKLGCILSMWRIRMNAIWILRTYVFLTHLWDIGMKSVTYWYQFFTRGEELVPIIHGVKFTKCEIYGSTQLYYRHHDIPGAGDCIYHDVAILILCWPWRKFFIIKKWSSILVLVLM